MANTLDAFPGGAVGFIDWLDAPLLSQRSRTDTTPYDCAGNFSVRLRSRFKRYREGVTRHFKASGNASSDVAWRNRTIQNVRHCVTLRVHLIPAEVGIIASDVSWII